MTTPQVGDAVRLWQGLVSMTWYGLVADSDTPPMNAATMEVADGEAVVTTDVLVGPQGRPGVNAPIIELVWEDRPESSTQLPTNWGPEMKNRGFWIDGLVWVWTGTSWRSALPGPAGPIGATPMLTCTAETIPMSERGPGVTDEVIQTGTSINPHVHFRLLAPQGPIGPSTNIGGAPDYDGSGGADPGKVLTVLNNGLWGPSEASLKHPHLYSVPEAAFTNRRLNANRFVLLSTRIEAQDYDWIPFVTGHFRIYGVELDRDPLTIGTEVRMTTTFGVDDPTAGVLIGRSHGNNSTWSTIVPHFSDSGNPTGACAPGNGVGMVRAGQDALININVRNDGLFGIWLFNRTGAQFSVLTIPAD